ncbi:MAG: TIGR04282 family arsenosugar biosynthesis glycosyltransferase [Acidobacteriota bacterium]
MPLPSLILFARAPEPGRVKTRLAVRLTDAGAADLYDAFLADAARVYRDARRWRSVLCAESDPPGPRLEALFAAPWLHEAQVPGDLGDRLSAAFMREFRRGAPAALAVGSDHPSLPRERLAQCFEELERGSDAAIIPAEDGGYCAISLSAGAPLEAVFRDISWSTDAVLRETVARMDEAAMRYRLLDPGYDVDRPEDLERLQRDLAQRDPAAEDYPVATAKTLAAWMGVAP